MPRPIPARPLLAAVGQLGLLAVLVVALRGTLPGTDRGRPGPGSPAGPVVVVALAVAVLVVALVVTLGRGDPRARVRSRRVTLPWPRPTWRTVAVAAAALGLVIGLFVVLRAVVPAPSAAPPTAAPSPTSPPTPGATPDPGPVDEPPTASSTLWPLILTALPVLLALLAAGTFLTRRHRRDTYAGAGDPPTGGGQAGGALAEAAAQGLAAVTEPSRDPRTAIIDCYRAMERGLADAPGGAPRPSETASEVLARATENGLLRSGAAGRLVGLFTEARFSPHEMTESHRASAATALREVLDDLRGAPCVS